MVHMSREMQRRWMFDGRWHWPVIRHGATTGMKRGGQLHIGIIGSHNIDHVLLIGPTRLHPNANPNTYGKFACNHVHKHVF
jgi:hypothetical protein